MYELTNNVIIELLYIPCLDNHTTNLWYDQACCLPIILQYMQYVHGSLAIVLASMKKKSQNLYVNSYVI